jgi:superfamily II DNA or RNA helicase
VFCVDVAHAKELKKTFIAKGIQAEYVVGDTLKEDRTRILEDYSAGKTKNVLRTYDQTNKILSIIPTMCRSWY